MIKKECKNCSYAVLNKEEDVYHCIFPWEQDDLAPCEKEYAAYTKDMIHCPKRGSVSMVNYQEQDNVYSTNEDHYHDYQCACGCDFRVRFKAIETEVLAAGA